MTATPCAGLMRHRGAGHDQNARANAAKVPLSGDGVSVAFTGPVEAIRLAGITHHGNTACARVNGSKRGAWSMNWSAGPAKPSGKLDRRRSDDRLTQTRGPEAAPLRVRSPDRPRRPASRGPLIHVRGRQGWTARAPRGAVGAAARHPATYRHRIAHHQRRQYPSAIMISPTSRPSTEHTPTSRS
jgi:hypothetical protein